MLRLLGTTTNTWSTKYERSESLYTRKVTPSIAFPVRSRLRPLRASVEYEHCIPNPDTAKLCLRPIWNADTDVAVGMPLEGHTERVMSAAYSPDGQHIISGSTNRTVRMWDSFTHLSIPLSFYNPMSPDFCVPPNRDGWVKDSKGGLLIGYPGLSYRLAFTCSPDTPKTSYVQSVSLDFEDFAFGTPWTQIFNSTQP